MVFSDHLRQESKDEVHELFAIPEQQQTKPSTNNNSRLHLKNELSLSTMGPSQSIKQMQLKNQNSGNNPSDSKEKVYLTLSQVNLEWHLLKQRNAKLMETLVKKLRKIQKQKNIIKKQSETISQLNTKLNVKLKDAKERENVLRQSNNNKEKQITMLKKQLKSLTKQLNDQQNQQQSLYLPNPELLPSISAPVMESNSSSQSVHNIGSHNNNGRYSVFGMKVLQHSKSANDIMSYGVSHYKSDGDNVTISCRTPVAVVQSETNPTPCRTPVSVPQRSKKNPNHHVSFALFPNEQKINNNNNTSHSHSPNANVTTNYDSNTLQTVILDAYADSLQSNSIETEIKQNKKDTYYTSLVTDKPLHRIKRGSISSQSNKSTKKKVRRRTFSFKNHTDNENNDHNIVQNNSNNKKHVKRKSLFSPTNKSHKNKDDIVKFKNRALSPKLRPMSRSFNSKLKKQKPSNI